MAAGLSEAAVHVTSAVELTAAQTEALRALLSRKLSRPVHIMQRVDPSVIGGLYIHVGGHAVDRTVKKQLSDLKDSIKRRGAG